MFRLLKLSNVPILEQLQLEEALLRTSQENWCLLNTGSSPAIVMGISGKPEKLLDLERVKQHNLPLIKRFSGGGTVYIDPQTVFATFICNASTFSFPLQPKAILSWSETFYRPLFGLTLRENDYALGDRKCAGNALYIQKERWLLHTSFLWDYSISDMECLLLPEKRPTYRGDRSHADFLCPLRPLFPCKVELLNTLAQHVCKTFLTQHATLQEASIHQQLPHRTATLKLNSETGLNHDIYSKHHGKCIPSNTESHFR